MIKVAKVNFVVMKILMGGHKKDSQVSRVVNYLYIKTFWAKKHHDSFSYIFMFHEFWSDENCVFL